MAQVECRCEDRYSAGDPWAGCDCAKLAWTKTPPTQDGCYWFIEEWGEWQFTKPEVATIAHELMWIAGRETAYLTAEVLIGWWAGPLEPPSVPRSPQDE